MFCDPIIRNDRYLIRPWGVILVSMSEKVTYNCNEWKLLLFVCHVWLTNLTHTHSPPSMFCDPIISNDGERGAIWFLFCMSHSIRLSFCYWSPFLLNYILVRTMYSNPVRASRETTGCAIVLCPDSHHECRRINSVAQYFHQMSSLVHQVWYGIDFHLRLIKPWTSWRWTPDLFKNF